MKWSPQQDRALMELAAFLKDPTRFIFRLWGEAGTGKTTMAAEIRDRFASLTFLALAYTGKAASVLRSKGWENASTAHSHLYIPSGQSRKRLEEWQARLAEIHWSMSRTPEEEAVDGALSSDERAAFIIEEEDLAKKIAEEEKALKSPMFVFNQDNDLHAFDVVVLDEVSMIGEQLGADLEKTCRANKIKLILMGDPFQLPPVRSRAYFMEAKPDFQLTEIHRQAKDDPIIWLSQKAKNRERLPLGLHGQSKVMRKENGSDGEMAPEQMAELVECDQLLVGKNDTRTWYNSQLRKAKGYSDLLEVGEKLMCLANSKAGFFNGSIWYVQDIFDHDEQRGRIEVSLSSDDVMEEDRICKLWTKSLMGQEVHFTERSGAECMVSAQAVTVHKFQGSQGRHIVLLDESQCARDDAHRWLYTGITRAQERLTVMVK